MRYLPIILIGLFALALVAGCTNVSTPGENKTSSANEISGAAESQIDSDIIPDNSTGVEIGEMI